MAATSVLSFHDAVELFLILCAEHLDVGGKTQMNFVDFWGKLGDKMPNGTELPGKKAMERMNKIRVNLKHNGVIPSAESIDQVRADVYTFFTDATPLVFGGEFSSIDMADLLTDTATIDLLRAAQEYADRGDFPAAMAGLKLAFIAMLDRYAKSNFPGAPGPFSFGNDVGRFSDSVFPLGSPRFLSHDATSRAIREATTDLRERLNKTAGQVGGLTEVTRRLQLALRVTSLGIDYARYTQFEILTPQVDFYYAGGPSFTVDPVQKSHGLDQFRWARLFVIESSLQAAKAEAALQQLAKYDGIFNVAMNSEHRRWTLPEDVSKSDESSNDG
ncbi:hypothetical protein ACIQI7_38540 [Kitasatospora sp. NPDC092039]|uniref:hypothetical protein n=1 Tax=Kitasatospora sp. NPDC092039 TaxID=3364086 RepID=UPI0038174030